VFSCEWHNNDFNWFDFIVHQKSNVAEGIALPCRMPTEDAMAADFSVFLEPEAMRVNRARQEHLSSLGLDLHAKRVLEVGAGDRSAHGFF
jgi:hypothetical protein